MYIYLFTHTHAHTMNENTLLYSLFLKYFIALGTMWEQCIVGGGGSIYVNATPPAALSDSPHICRCLKDACGDV